jgi:CubicO group peptidase (beta-lactamase class C family)
MWISAHDLARFGHLTLCRGKWGDRQLLSEKWVEQAMTPTELRPTYGFMNWFLNTDRELAPSIPENHFYHGGAGVNRVWVMPELDTVVVVRWISGDRFDGFAKLMYNAVNG